MDVKINVEKVVIFDRTKKEKETVIMNKKDGIKLGLEMVNSFGVATIVGKTVNKVVMTTLNNNPIAKAAVTVASIGLSMVVTEKVNDRCNQMVDEIFEVVEINKHFREEYEDKKEEN